MGWGFARGGGRLVCLRGKKWYCFKEWSRESLFHQGMRQTDERAPGRPKFVIVFAKWGNLNMDIDLSICNIRVMHNMFEQVRCLLGLNPNICIWQPISQFLLLLGLKVCHAKNHATHMIVMYKVVDNCYIND